MHSAPTNNICSLCLRLQCSPQVRKFGSSGAVSINTATLTLPNSQTPSPVCPVRDRLHYLPTQDWTMPVFPPAGPGHSPFIPVEPGWGQAVPHNAGSHSSLMGPSEASLAPVGLGLGLAAPPPLSTCLEGGLSTSSKCWIGTTIQPMVRPGTVHPAHWGKKLSTTAIVHAHLIQARECHPSPIISAYKTTVSD